MHYNFVRIHESLRITPAMAASVTTKLWSLTDMVRVIEDCGDRRYRVHLNARIVQLGCQTNHQPNLRQLGG
jgi:hypothetical protein